MEEDRPAFTHPAPELRPYAEGRSREAGVEKVHPTSQADMERLLHEQQAEAALQAERDYLLQMLNILPQGVVLLGPDGKIEFANPAVERQWGYAPDALLGRETLDFIHPDDRFLALQFRQQRLQGEVTRGILRYRRADGSFEHDLVTGSPLIQNGQLRGIILVLNDLSAVLQNEATLRGSEKTLSVLLNSIPESVLLTDSGGIIQAMNAAGAARSGLAETESAGACLYDYLPPAIAEVHRARMAEAIRTGHPVQFEDQRAGRIFDNRIHPVVEADGTVKRVAILGIDVTARRQAEEALRQAQDMLEQRVRERTAELTAVNAALRESEERYRILVETSPDAVMLTDLQGKVLMANGQAARLCCCADATELEGFQVLDLIEPADRLRFAANFQQAAQTGQISPLEYSMVKCGGTAFAGELTAALIRDAEGQPRALISVLRDITERKTADAEQARLLAEVRAANTELHQLSRRLVAVQEEERHAIGRELHDEVGQTLTGLLLMLDTLPAVPPETVEPLRRVRSLAVELADRLRDLSLDLRPSLLDDLGLLPTLAWHFQRYHTQTQVRVDFRHAGLNRRFPPEAETAAYRIVQEALTNVARHARVEEVIVRAWADATNIYAKIEDHGVGFVEGLGPGQPVTGGLSGMRERARLLGGGLTITTFPGAGTTVEAVLPI